MSIKKIFFLFLINLYKLKKKKLNIEIKMNILKSRILDKVVLLQLHQQKEFICVI